MEDDLQHIDALLREFGIEDTDEDSMEFELDE